MLKFKLYKEAMMQFFFLASGIKYYSVGFLFQYLRLQLLLLYRCYYIYFYVLITADKQELFSPLK